MNFIKNLIRDEQGATAIEYGLIAALIAVAAITAMTSLGSTLEATFTEVDGEMQEGLEANN
ncbi:Flp family type IVb pilin [Porphyrobacter sp. SLTP]|jgi:pilus assembly protein Flp/PilA|uniref:Flp family type IVb pilin n=1 Tax=Porphyrobacter sp. SLTP TaxID=2683266 RepID=UPI001412D362|nr:Flp family type IVb pilin [Porphyrobacter sp. SLTP]NBB24691.1 Flp family type IVb pilin [Porphyrobacter sp. SLTP]